MDVVVVSYDPVTGTAAVEPHPPSSKRHFMRALFQSLKRPSTRLAKVFWETLSDNKIQHFGMAGEFEQ